jgi:exopolyphosphatase/guanosine-5'-triphosphate,3'-diphosphate pyrophosphatase
MRAVGPGSLPLVGVIDIGSNSLRLVVYDGLTRAPVPLFNEKAMCGLARGLEASGRLNPEGAVQARVAVARFVLLARQLGVERLDVIATSAVRDAADGPEFVAGIERECGITIRVIDGASEGRMAAAGVRAGIPDAEGIVGDLGGGSVELAWAGRRPPRQVTSLPLGPLRFLALSGEDGGARRAIDQAVARVGWLGEGKGRPFYAVGGAWRALARLHMEQAGYKLHIIHNYTIPMGDAASFLDVLLRQSKRSLDRAPGISRKRLETVPLAAYVLQRILGLVQPVSVVFSAYGLREGLLYELLSPAEQAQDPLIVASTRMAEGHTRFGAAGEELAAWTDPLFTGDSPADRRLRRVGALLSDIAWNEHPDYRAEHAFLHALRMPVPGIDHAGRVFLATMLHARYGGPAEAPQVTELRHLIGDGFDRARAIGAALRLAYSLTGGAPRLIATTGFRVESGVTYLCVPDHTAIYAGEAVQRRLDALGRALGRRMEIRVEPAPHPIKLRAGSRGGS